MLKAPNVWLAQPDEPLALHWWRSICIATVLLFMVMQLMGGVVRWVLDLTGLAPLTYVPNLLMMVCITMTVGFQLVHRQLGAGAVLVVALVGLTLSVGFVTTGRPAQAAFGLWVLLPFFFGLCCAPALMLHQRGKVAALAAFFILAALGVVLHKFLEYPWVGVAYQVGGVELEGAREWTTSGGAQRLSGFARSSFDVAGQLVVVAGLLSLRTHSFGWRLLLWALCTAAVSLSTSKGILLALLMTFIASEALIRRNIAVMVGSFLVGIAWLFVPPILGWTLDWSQEARTDLNNPLYGSFIDRMNDMWPRALALAHEHGIAMLGRGMGGIGVPQGIFEPDLVNAGDNLFVYVYVLLGVLSLPLFTVGFVQLIKTCWHLQRLDIREMLVLAVIVNWYGGVSNILEHAVLALALGIVCRYLAAMMAGNLPLSSNDQVLELG